MDEELKEVKSVLRSLVVSSSSQMDVRSLLRDYREMMGGHLLIAKFGYRDPVLFLKEKCADCFLFNGSSGNPYLTPIVPETMKHIDKFVQRQKSSTASKIKGKRRSVQESYPKENNLVAKTFCESQKWNNNINDINETHNNNKETDCIKKENKLEQNHNLQPNFNKSETTVKGIDIDRDNSKETDLKTGACSSTALQNFLRKRTPLFQSSLNVQSEKSFEDGDSGQQTSSSSSSIKQTQFKELQAEIEEIVAEHPDGVWCTSLIRLYRSRYGRELNFARFGYTSVVSLACALELRVTEAPALTDWLLSDPMAPAPSHLFERLDRNKMLRRSMQLPVTNTVQASTNTDDALPGIDFDPDVFPEDCVHFLESIPALSVDSIAPGAMLEVVVGEVYSPSHFWLIRLAEQYSVAMEDCMDEMNEYYGSVEGAERWLSRGACRVGHYCASQYDGDWHRALIVRLLDSTSAKVRLVDYGTVQTAELTKLKALPRRWAQLPAQGLRASLCGVRPAAGGRRWARAAAAAFLEACLGKRLVANVVAVDVQENILEVLLIDTSTEEDVCLSSLLIRAGHADPRPDSALRTCESYLYPLFSALEMGATPNYGDIHALLNDGIALECVPDYRTHVLLPTLATVAEQSGERVPSEPDTCGKDSDRRKRDLEKHMHELRLRPPPSPPPLHPPPPPPTIAPHPFPFAPPLFPPGPHWQPGPPPLYPPPTFFPLLPEPHFIPAMRSSFPNFDVPRPPFPSTERANFDVSRPPFPSTERVSDAKCQVSLSASECEVFRLLSKVDATAAHKYITETLNRALGTPGSKDTLPSSQPGRSALDPDAPEFRSAQTQTVPQANAPVEVPVACLICIDEEPMRPPPGFQNFQPVKPLPR